MTTPGSDPGGRADSGPSPAARRFVWVALALLLVPGIVGFDLWPLTGWRLFSLARTDTQTFWVLHATTDDAPDRVVSLEELPLRYRHAAWPMAGLADASEERREALCQALLEPTLEVVPDLVELHIVEDRQRLVTTDAGPTVRHHPIVRHSCSPGTSEGR